MLVTITSFIFVLIGLVLGGGGIWLLLLGGSWFYAFAGLMFLLTAFFLWRRRIVALWLYALLVLVALVWALLEVGFDWWALMPRGGIIILLGLWLAMPWIVGPLRQRTDDGRRGLQAAPLLVSLVIAIVVAVVSMFNAPHDLTGVLPTDVVAQTPTSATHRSRATGPITGAPSSVSVIRRSTRSMSAM